VLINPMPGEPAGCAAAAARGQTAAIPKPVTKSRRFIDHLTSVTREEI